MKVYLDDKRVPPEGWILVKWPFEAIELLKTGKVTHLSLDHDLGAPVSIHCSTSANTGMEVLEWLEKEIGCGDWTKPLPVITIHSMNPVAQQRMNQALRKIQQMAIL